MNDRALRKIIVGLGGAANGVPREDGFDITAASEIMAILCLVARPRRSEGAARPHRRRLHAATARRSPRATWAPTGAMTALLRDALQPNLVQTAGGRARASSTAGRSPTSRTAATRVLATRHGARRSADYVITEAGFGFDLGGEKFLDIKCRAAGLARAPWWSRPSAR